MEEQQFIQRALSHLQPAANSLLLEVGCGEGERARALAAQGFDVTGIDANPESIATALQSEQERLHFYTHDIRLPFHINFFHYAFNLFSNFGFYRTQREHYNAIRTISHSLKPKGILLIDYVNIHQSPGNGHAPLTPGDFNEMFAFHRLQMQDVFGDYALNAYDLKKSPRLIMIAQKQ